MADVEKININSTDYDIADAKALRNKDTAGANSFIDTRAGTAQYPTTQAHINSLILGKEAHVRDTTSRAGFTILGEGAYANMSYATVIGNMAHANGSQTTAIGYAANAGGNQAVAIGNNATANSVLGIAIGSGASINSGQYSILIGSGSGLTGQSSILLGYGASISADYSIAFGRGSTVGSNSSYSVAIGYGATASNNSGHSISLGYNARTTSSYAAQIGEGTNSGYGSLQFRGWQLVNNSGKIPEERLPDGIKTATPSFPNLYDANEENVSERAILYTGATNDAYTNSQFYRGRVQYGYPHFSCGYVDNEWIDSQNDVMIDQQKLFTKLAEITKQRIDDNDVANGVFGGDNSEMSIYLHYDADNDYYFLRFDSDSFEKAFNSTPDDITGLSFDDLADYGIYFRNFHKPSDLEGEYEFCDIYYYAPVYVDSYDWNNSPDYMNYLKFLEGINDGDWGIGVVISDRSDWTFKVDGTYYSCPIIPKTYEWNGDEYDSVEFRWEWNGTDWSEYINGEDIAHSWTTAEMYTTFGIHITSGEESNIDHIGLTVRGAEQRYWQQFNPIDESKLATARAVSDLQTALNVDEETKMFKRFQSARDLDTMTTAGQYKVEAIGSTNLPTQASGSRYFWLFVTNFANNNTEIRQVLIADRVTMTSGGGDYSRYAPNIFVRCKYNNVWSSWKPLLTDEASVWIQGFDRTKKQMLVHLGNNNTMLWEDAE